jgi:hypothetical protein
MKFQTVALLSLLLFSGLSVAQPPDLLFNPITYPRKSVVPADGFPFTDRGPLVYDVNGQDG